MATTNTAPPRQSDGPGRGLRLVDPAGDAAGTPAAAGPGPASAPVTHQRTGTVPLGDSQLGGDVHDDVRNRKHGPLASRGDNSTGDYRGARRFQAINSPVPLLIDAKECARLCDIGERTWWTRNSAGSVPAPVKIGHATRWRRAEIEAWIEAGCPDRRTWEEMRAAGSRGVAGIKSRRR